MTENEKNIPNETLRLKDKSVIVTGAASGIGRAIAVLFAEQGAKVLVADIDDKGGQETVEKIRSAEGEAIFQHTDVSKQEDVIKMAAVAVEKFESIDVLVNNAAAFVFGKIEDLTQEDWIKVLGVNVIGYANCVKEVLPAMKKTGGVIINMASISSFVADAEFVPYNTSKGAVLQLTRTLAMDLAKHGIRVNSICPGSIRTPAADNHIKEIGLELEEGYRQAAEDAVLKRVGTPEEVAYGALFLASNESSFVTGTHLVIDGGASID